MTDDIHKLPKQTKAQLYRALDEYRIAFIMACNNLYSKKLYDQGLTYADVIEAMDNVSGWLQFVEGDEIQYVVTTNEAGRPLLVPISHYGRDLISQYNIREYQGTQDYVDKAIIVDENPQIFILEPTAEVVAGLAKLANQNPNLMRAFGLDPEDFKNYKEEDK